MVGLFCLCMGRMIGCWGLPCGLFCGCAGLVSSCACALSLLCWW